MTLAAAHPVPAVVDLEPILRRLSELGPPSEVRSRAVTWLGAALMMLGGFSILSATRARRHAVKFRH